MHHLVCAFVKLAKEFLHVAHHLLGTLHAGEVAAGIAFWWKQRRHVRYLVRS